MSIPDSSPFSWIDEELDSLSERDLRRSRSEVNPLPNGKCEGGGQILWNFAANDYLGLADHPDVIAATRKALSSGLGSRASALVTGRSKWHVELEEQLARWKNTESALLFPTGFAANVGTISALAGSEDSVFCDRLNHASLIDGARNSKAKFLVYPHCDVDSLRRELIKKNDSRRRMIITDSLFSMDGDVAPLRDLTSLAEEFNAMLLVDEAHASGVFGRTGAGLLEEQEIRSDALVSIGTLSKAIGAQGGFVTGSKPLCEILWNKARTSMFSTALSPVLCAGSVAAIDVIQKEPHRREWIHKQSEVVQSELREAGWNIPENVQGPIIPVIVEDPRMTLELSERLIQAGILVAAIRPPTVPNGTSRLRISLSYSHGEEGIITLIKAFKNLNPPQR